MKNLLNAPLEFLNDFHGGKSSKRFWGNRLLTIGILLKLNLYLATLLTPAIFFALSLLDKFKDLTIKQFPQNTFDNCDSIANYLIGFGASLLFVAMGERLKWMRK